MSFRDSACERSVLEGPKLPGFSFPQAVSSGPRGPASPALRLAPGLQGRQASPHGQMAPASQRRVRASQSLFLSFGVPAFKGSEQAALHSFCWCSHTALAMGTFRDSLCRPPADTTCLRFAFICKHTAVVAVNDRNLSVWTVLRPQLALSVAVLRVCLRLRALPQMWKWFSRQRKWTAEAVLGWETRSSQHFTAGRQERPLSRGGLRGRGLSDGRGPGPPSRPPDGLPPCCHHTVVKAAAEWSGRAWAGPVGWAVASPLGRHQRSVQVDGAPPSPPHCAGPWGCRCAEGWRPGFQVSSRIQELAPCHHLSL
ncbi:uncharacterized protein LOC123826017 [Phyllostomus hastatus]|uniref:uncharacterized protein LOC123826017 n=1 Tax=Phyllostomus hastatus TaxID=9423 RepID=UPI001E684ECC|nr:uncharacterized protein LOC123826017 [Phyllostomus hastatus]